MVSNKSLTHAGKNEPLVVSDVRKSTPAWKVSKIYCIRPIFDFFFWQVDQRDKNRFCKTMASVALIDTSFQSD